MSRFAQRVSQSLLFSDAKKGGIGGLCVGVPLIFFANGMNIKAERQSNINGVMLSLPIFLIGGGIILSGPFVGTIASPLVRCAIRNKKITLPLMGCCLVSSGMYHIGNK